MTLTVDIAINTCRISIISFTLFVVMLFTDNYLQKREISVFIGKNSRSVFTRYNQELFHFKCLRRMSRMSSCIPLLVMYPTCRGQVGRVRKDSHRDMVELSFRWTRCNHPLFILKVPRARMTNGCASLYAQDCFFSAG